MDFTKKRLSTVDYAPIELQSTPYDNANIKPIYNRAPGTRSACITGLTFSVCVGIGFIIFGVLAKGRDRIFHLNSVALELIPLAINVVVLAVTESLGYIHATSLRWALFYEGKLEFNTNLRLLTFSRRNFANGWIANLLFFTSLALCYGASPMILVRNTYGFYLNDGGDWNDYSHRVSISQTTPIVLGTAILLQAALAIWCLFTSRIPTWSSDPLTTLAAATHHGGLVRRKGRSMMSAHMRSLPAAPTAPVTRQKSPYAVSPRILHVLFAVTIVSGALVVWTGIIIKVSLSNPKGSWSFIPSSAVDPGSNWSDFTPDMTKTVFLKWFSTSGGGNPSFVPERNVFAVLAFCVLIQSILTVGLHCAELQVILLRDEAIWRTLASPIGSKPESTYNSVTRPFQSLPNIMLLLFKPVVHWFFGSALQIDYAKGVLMRVPHITYLMILWLFFLGFVAFISFTRPKGTLPATYGHLQTMADVADEVGGIMFFGDKGSADATDLSTESEVNHLNAARSDGYELRHAGTSSMPLPPVNVGVSYM